MIDITQLLSLNPRQVTVRTKSRDNQSTDSNPVLIPGAKNKPTHHHHHHHHKVNILIVHRRNKRRKTGLTIHIYIYTRVYLVLLFCNLSVFRIISIKSFWTLCIFQQEETEKRIKYGSAMPSHMRPQRNAYGQVIVDTETENLSDKEIFPGQISIPSIGTCVRLGIPAVNRRL